MNDASDSRFSSAAVFAHTGEELRQSIQPKLASLGWKRAHGWKNEEYRSFNFAPPPMDFSPWVMGPGLLGWILVQSETLHSKVGESLAQSAITFISERPPHVRGNLVTVLAPDYREVDFGIGRSGKTYLRVSSSLDGAPLPSTSLLAPWLGCRTCRYGSTMAQLANTLSAWTTETLQSLIGELARYAIALEFIQDHQWGAACEAVARDIAGKVTYASHSVTIPPEHCGETFPVVRDRIPGYVFSSFLAAYVKGFDPYDRPKAADEGKTMRYPLVTCERRKLDKDGKKDIHIDVVHRPQGDCFFDLQVLDTNPDNDKVVRKTLADAIASLDVNAEIWDGDPFQRWQQ